MKWLRGAELEDAVEAALVRTQIDLRKELWRQERENRWLADGVADLQQKLGASNVRIVQLKQALLKLEGAK